MSEETKSARGAQLCRLLLLLLPTRHELRKQFETRCISTKSVLCSHGVSRTCVFCKLVFILLPQRSSGLILGCVKLFPML